MLYKVFQHTSGACRHQPYFVGWEGKGKKKNKTPKGIMRSAVPLPCLFDVVKSQNVAGQRPRQGTKSCRMGRKSVLRSEYTFFYEDPVYKETRLRFAENYGQLRDNPSLRCRGKPIFLLNLFVLLKFFFFFG